MTPCFPLGGTNCKSITIHLSLNELSDMTTLPKVLAMISMGESPTVEFKSRDVDSHSLAKKIVGFLNADGGTVIIGVEDDRKVTGIDYADLEQKAVASFRYKIDPPVKLEIKEITDVSEGKSVAVIEVPRGDSVHAVLHHHKRRYCVRVNTQNHDLSTLELAELFQRRGPVKAELQPVRSTNLEDLDLRRIKNYFEDVRVQVEHLDEIPHQEMQSLLKDILRDQEMPANKSDLQQMLNNTMFMNMDAVTIAGLMLFGSMPRKHLNSAGISAKVYSGKDNCSEITDNETISGPMTPLLGEDRRIISIGVVEKALEFIRRHTQAESDTEEVETPVKELYPEVVVREAIVNALVHREYLFYNTDIELSIFSDRLEIISPGQLPNGMTLENLKSGKRAVRNQLLQRVMSEYKYLGHLGKGIPLVIKGMQEHNGTEPSIVEKNRCLHLTLRSAQAQDSTIQPNVI